MQYYNSLGCLSALFIFMFIFLGVSRLLFTTPLGWILLGFIAYRMIRANSARKAMESEFRQNVNHEPEEHNSPKNPEDFFETDDFVDIDYEEIDDE